MDSRGGVPQTASPEASGRNGLETRRPVRLVPWDGIRDVNEWGAVKVIRSLNKCLLSTNKESRD